MNLSALGLAFLVIGFVVIMLAIFRVFKGRKRNLARLAGALLMFAGLLMTGVPGITA